MRNVLLKIATVFRFAFFIRTKQSTIMVRGKTGSLPEIWFLLLLMEEVSGRKLAENFADRLAEPERDGEGTQKCADVHPEEDQGNFPTDVRVGFVEVE